MAARRRVVPEDYAKSGLLGMACSGGGPAMAAIFSNPLDVTKVCRFVGAAVAFCRSFPPAPLWKVPHDTGMCVLE
jgi:hypothetical protein